MVWGEAGELSPFFLPFSGSTKPQRDSQNETEIHKSCVYDHRMKLEKRRIP